MITPIRDSEGYPCDCIKCRDTGVLNSGHGQVPCSCKYGDQTLFAVAGVDGLLPGSIVKKHFVKGCPEPIKVDPNVKISSAFFSDGESAKDGTHQGLNSSYLKIDGKLVPIDAKIFTNLCPDGVNSTDISNPYMIIRKQDTTDQDHYDLGNGEFIEFGHP